MARLVPVEEGSSFNPLVKGRSSDRLLPIGSPGGGTLE
jgi:hypothetical protein